MKCGAVDDKMLEEFYEKTVGGDPNELSKVEVRELLKVLDEEKKHHLENKTWNSINQQTRFILKSSVRDAKTRREYYEKLKDEYRYVDEVHELDKGKYVRWLKEDEVLTNGAFVCDITTGIEGIIVVCKNAQNRFVRYNFNKNITFQKITVSEKIILEVKDFITE